ncbi:MAG: O-methyltransferase [Lasallia pustulata]|uniref:O-methyltransferase n=1 Tax=Lasallia pustulata TaxID=136370 RepID=A0A5M8PHB2_9LECA|nr:MAG: O-methyltransferase [Lasallia pustulata]
MEDPNRLRELTTEVQSAVDAYIKSDDIANYEELQIRLKRLQVASSKPADMLFTFRVQPESSRGDRKCGDHYLNEMGVLDALMAKEGTTATAADLAAATGCKELMIARLMRVACALLFCEETDEMTYRTNQITSLLVKPGWKAALQLPEVLYPVVADIRRFLSSTNFGRTGAESASSAFEFSHGKTIWKVLEEQPNQRRNFDMWLREKRMHEENHWHKRFPPCVSLSSANLKTGPDAVLMVDIGGATGSQEIDFKAQFPHLPGRYVLQDLYALKLNGATKHPEGVELMAYDFFTPQPIKGARFYYFRNIFHDWPDEKCAEILRNLVPAMDPEYSTLLIDDFVLPTKNT